MTNQNQKQPNEMETKAKTIRRKLKRLQQKCADHTEKVCDFVNANEEIYFSHWKLINFSNWKTKTLEIHIGWWTCIYYGIYGRTIDHRPSTFVSRSFHRTLGNIFGEFLRPRKKIPIQKSKIYWKRSCFRSYHNWMKTKRINSQPVLRRSRRYCVKWLQTSIWRQNICVAC